jgi:hypothetical protein
MRKTCCRGIGRSGGVKRKRLTGCLASVCGGALEILRGRWREPAGPRPPIYLSFAASNMPSRVFSGREFQSPEGNNPAAARGDEFTKDSVTAPGMTTRFYRVLLTFFVISGRYRRTQPIFKGGEIPSFLRIIQQFPVASQPPPNVAAIGSQEVSQPTT